MAGKGGLTLIHIQGTVEVDQKPAEDNLRGKVLLEVRFLVAQVVVLHVWPAKVRQPNGRLHPLQPGKRKAEFKV